MAVEVPPADRMVVWGGGGLPGGYPTNLDDLWTLDWSDIVDVPSPPPPSPGCPLTLAAGPNPAIGTATIRFAIPAAGPVRLSVFDLAGRRVRVLLDGEATAGPHRVVWDRRTEDARARSGVYVCELVAGTHRITSRLVVLD